MYSLKVYNTLKEINEISYLWNELYRNNEELSPFQTYEWNKCLIQYNMLRGKLRCFILYKYDKPILIAPLVEINKILYKEIEFLGVGTQSDYFNFIYTMGLSFQDFDYFINTILNRYRNVILRLELINETSRIASFVELLKVPQRKYKGLCVKIPISKTEEEYRNSLGKSTRRELKYKQNYLQKNIRNIKFTFHKKMVLGEEIIEELLTLYSKRREEKKNTINENYKQFLKQYIKENKENFLAACLIDNNIAAYNLGFITPSGSICILIVAIDAQYKKYNIGNLLLYSSICYLIGEGDDNSKLEYRPRYYDLTRGDELYKYKYGGIKHFNYNYVLSRKKQLLLLHGIVKGLVSIYDNPKILLNKIRRLFNLKV